MKKFFFLFIVFVVFFQSNIFSIDRIHLDKTCDESNNCVLHKWYLIDNYKEEYPNLTSPLDGSKAVDKFPIPAQKYFPDTDSMNFTYYTEFEVSKDYLNPEIITGIHFEAVGDVYTFYLNGKKIGSEGKVENGEVKLSRYGKYLKYPLNFSNYKEGKNNLVVHIQGHPKFNLVGFFASGGYFLDEYDTIVYEKRDRTGIVLYFLYLFVGAYHLFFYIKRRNEKYNLYYAFISISTFLYMMSRGGLLFEYGVDSTIGYKFELAVVFFLVSSFGLFFDEMFFGKLGKIIKSYFIFCITLLVIEIFLPQHKLIYILRLWQISALFALCYYVYTFIKAIRMKSASAKRLFTGAIILIISTLFDVLDSMIFKMNLVVSRYAFFAFIVGIAGILANRFINLHETVEELNKNLEDKVQKRTKELQESLTQVKLLKEQQDGDYFLTTLIIEPLASNTEGDDKINISILTRQKKKFEFRKKVHEIGGDICISEIIYLRGQKFTAFVNGDAMGKSIQGAGGALVLGVVFKSIISRAESISNFENVFPERWLKLAFQELQSVFESFDGSMMVSVVMGLVDNENGFIYYLNAEHPFSVLYRDGKASFLETDLNLRKIGMTVLEHSGDFHINTFKLENHDVILIGSDGRDDIKVGEDEEGARMINEDEKLFLKTVEEAKGELQQIFKITESKGELTDDYSLLKIEYNNSEIPEPKEKPEEYKTAKEYFEKENFNEALKVISQIPDKHSFPEVIKLKADILFYLNQFQQAAEYYSIYSKFHPEDSEILYYASKSYRYSDSLESAADYGERLKLREPRNLEILILLTEIYIGLKNYRRAEKILETTKKIAPEEERLLTLQKNLDDIVHIKA